MRLVVALLTAVSLAVCTAAFAAPRADIVAYGDHVPSLTISGTPFQNPFDNREDANDAYTRVAVEAVPGLKHPLGSIGWGVVAFGKYVLTGNYDEAMMGLFQNIDDQRMGVFDSERKTFCQLDLEPGLAVNGGIEFMAVATPNARQSRIFLEGFAPSPLGWVDADLDNPHPCDPVTGWQVHLFDSGDIYDAAAALPADKKPCDLIFGSPSCSFDGMTLLRHDAATGADQIVLHNWFGHRVIVAKVDAGGTLTVLDTYKMPPWKPAAGNGACFDLNPVVVPAVDPTRPANDQRFTSGFDMICSTPDGTPGCASWVPLCPGSGTSCTLGSTCPKKVCTNGYADCTTNADCPFSTCTDACQLVHPGSICSVTTSRHCARTDDCPNGESCICGPGRPMQEFAFDGTTITPTSAQFQAASSHNSLILGNYDSYGGLWATDLVWDYAAPGAPNATFGVYGKNFAGEHDYYTTTNPAGSELWAPNLSFPFETSYSFFGLPSHNFQLDNVMYAVGLASIQRVIAGFGTWTLDTGYKVALGAGVLPREPKRCSAGANAGNACTTNSACPGSTCVVKESAVGQIYAADLTIGGAPPALLVNPRYGDNFKKHGNIDAYLLRVPVPVGIADGISSVRPGVVWTPDNACANADCDRLWLIAEHGGVLKYRVRDDGIWSGWYALPTNLATAGGASAILNASGAIELYARSTGGTVVTSTLTSATSCAAGSCTWSGWAGLPSSPITDAEPAATLQAGSDPFVAIRRSSDGRVVYARRHLGTWSTWRVADNGVLTNGAPAVVWNPNDTLSGRTWLVVRNASTGALHYGRVNDLAFGTWQALPTSGIEPWGTTPAAIFDGTIVRVFAADAAFPNYVSQITWTQGSGWDTWKTIFSRGQATLQPVAALMNGDVDLVTYWYTLGMFDQLVK